MTKYKNFARRPLGVGVIGAGRIGTHRARLAAQHPAVEYLAIADTDQDQVDKLVNATGAQFGTTDPYAVIADERVSVVIVATPEMLMSMR
jgi:predicted dehydrogenase